VAKPHSAARPWPDARITGASYERVETEVTCVLTRFRLRSTLGLLPCYFAFRRVREEARKVDGLLKALFLIENLHTCYTLSLWRDEWAILDFGTHVKSHVHAATTGITRSRWATGRPEIWSVQWKLSALGANLQWEGLDLPAILAQAPPLEEVTPRAEGGLR
jgi:hypothetical protein